MGEAEGDDAEGVHAERAKLGGLVAKKEAHTLSSGNNVTSLAELRAGDSFTGTVRILRNWPAKAFESRGRPGKVARAEISDGSKVLSLVAWNAQADFLGSLERGDPLRIEGGFAKAQEDAVELHASERAHLSKAPLKGAPGIEAFQLTYPRRKLGELREGEEAIVNARVVELNSLKTISKCQACSQRFPFPTNKCPNCTSVDLKRIDVLSAQLDDGSAGYRLACFGSQARDLAGSHSMDALDGLMDKVREKLSGKEVVLVVRPKSSTWGGGFELGCVTVVTGV